MQNQNRWELETMNAWIIGIAVLDLLVGIILPLRLSSLGDNAKSYVLQSPVR